MAKQELCQICKPLNLRVMEPEALAVCKEYRQGLGSEERTQPGSQAVGVPRRRTPSEQRIGMCS